MFDWAMHMHNGNSTAFVSPVGELPGVPPWSLYPTSDMTSYGRILKAVSNVADHYIRALLQSRILLKRRAWSLPARQIGMHSVSEF